MEEESMGNALLREFSVQPDEDPRFSMVTVVLSGRDGSMDIAWTARVFNSNGTRSVINAAIYEAIIWLGKIGDDEEWLESLKSTSE
jgi:hypothetical protein